MAIELRTETQFADGPRNSRFATLMRAAHLDTPLMIGLLMTCVIGLVILSSAVGLQQRAITAQAIRLAIGIVAMIGIAQIPPAVMRRWTPWGFLGGLSLLALVLLVGEVGQGARRWLDFGLRFQPSEIMKLAVPMFGAWWLHHQSLPPRWRDVAIVGLMIALPVGLIVLQPDLGTAILIASSGALVILLAGLRIQQIFLLGGTLLAALPLIWSQMHDYQKQRVLTLLDPQSDPLGAGYNIIQSVIAIGSGGVFGRGFNAGTQGPLGFLPERETDFIFAVLAEDFGLLGALALLLCYAFLIGRGLTIAVLARDTWSRLVAGSISLTFFIYVFVNVGMVCGLLPVVGVPLPLVSFGGTSMVTLMAGFGILMSIHTHRKLLPK